MSNILVIGAKGRVGSKLVEVLQETHHKVFAGARHGDSQAGWTGVSALKFNLDWSVQEMEDVLNDHEIEVIYFTAGSRGKNLLQADLHGAIKTMQAAERSGIKRYIMLTGSFSLVPERWKEFNFDNLADYYIAKHYADLYLQNNTQLDYTIFGPGALVETAGSGLIDVKNDRPGPNSIDNVAHALAKLVDMPNTIGKVINMNDGDTPIENALKSV